MPLCQWHNKLILTLSIIFLSFRGISSAGGTQLYSAAPALHRPVTGQSASSPELENSTRCSSEKKHCYCGAASCQPSASCCRDVSGPATTSSILGNERRISSGQHSAVVHTRASAAAPQPKTKLQTIAEIREENDWKNDLVLSWLPETMLERMPRIVRAWARCYVACMALYLCVSGAWAYYIYTVFGSSFFRGSKTPEASDILEQVKVSFLSIPFYSMLPAVEEWIIERGWTKAYSRVADVGIIHHLAYFLAFMASVEFGVYWMHRLLHDIRPGYKYLHYVHHKYNKENTLSPFAGLAFHPLDGILQAVPYCWTLFFIPAHSLTFELLLFLTGIWTTNIHDCIDGKVEPIMGAGYHSIHHTTYRHNYGHYFVYMDKLFGSLVTPTEYAAITTSEAPVKAH